MAALRRFLWFLLVLSFTEWSQSEFVREGEEAFLNCSNVVPGQSQCEKTTWQISSVDRGSAVELFTLGRIGSGVSELTERLKVSNLSERLTLTEQCGLRIRHVHPQEAGRFECRQYHSEHGPHISDSTVYLSVVSLTEKEEKQSLKFSCIVSSSWPEISVRWLYNNSVVHDDHDLIKVTPLHSGSKLSISKEHVLLQKKHLLKCEVKGDKTEDFSFKHSTSENPDQTNTNPIPQNESEENDNRDTSSGFKDWHWAVVVGALVLVVLVVVLIFWRRLRAKPRDPSMAPQVTDPAPQIESEDGVSYATISYNRNHRSEVRENEEAVTYSSVRIQASEDPLYATVNKTSKQTS